MNVPRIRFEGCDMARQMNRVFAENLYDLIHKVETGNGKYDAGFFHTSSSPHEGVHYYNDMWSRDVGRGLIEISRLGFADKAMPAARYILNHMNRGDHWGRTINHAHDEKEYELDGNALALLGVYHAWRIAGRDAETGREFVEAAASVFSWMERLMGECPYGSLIPSESELSGNPDTPYQVYGIFGNYAAKTAMDAFAEMATACGRPKEAGRFMELSRRLGRSLLDRLVAVRGVSLTEEGCWMNGLDGRDGRAYEFSEWAGTAWPIYHWTRQLPFILDFDRNLLSLPQDGFLPIHQKSYDYVRSYMCKSHYFYRYGFASNTGWSGTGGRHDDTMCGYGQGFMTQAALLADDINAYTKLLEGISTLAYDGNIVEPLAYDFNPWVMHECFNYPNFEKGVDHTFGEAALGRPGIMDNPGDEGNLVQEAEIVKAFSIVAGVENAGGGTVRFLPRLPWTFDEVMLKDFPIDDGHGICGTVEFRMQHERWRRSCSFIVRSTVPLKDVQVRVGPFPMNAKAAESETVSEETGRGCKWIWVKSLSGDYTEREIRLMD